MTRPVLINTRPAHRSDTINQLVDVQVINLPLLQIDTLPITKTEQIMMQEWLAGVYDALVVTSVESATRAIEFLEYHQKDISQPTDKQARTPIIAVGAATAQALALRGLSAEVPALSNNEGMLMMPVIEALTAGSRVLIWCGVGGRKLLQDTLLARGVRVDSICWYQRDKPDGLNEAFESVLPCLDKYQDVNNKTKPIFVLISSQTAYQIWIKLVDDYADYQGKPYHYLVLGARLTKMILAQGRVASMLDTLNADEILAVIANHMNK